MAFILQRRHLANQVQHQLEQATAAKGLETIEEGSIMNKTAIDIETIAATPPSEDAYLGIPGITRQIDRDGEWYYDVGWTDEYDMSNPKQWSTATRLGSTFLVCIVAFFATSASSIDSVIITRAAAEFGVSSVVESLATGLFLIGFGAGALLASPLSELVGRQPVYILSLLIFEGWTVGSALSPNITAQLIFRFLMGISASAPLTVAGGSISDMWTPLERTFAFPFYAIPGFVGPVFGPVIGTWIGNHPNLTWRWVEWLTLILTGVSIVLLFLFKRETFAPRILHLKSAAFRNHTGNLRFKTSKEASDAGEIMPILKRSFRRPFILCFEPIVICFTLYLTINYIILFTFLDGRLYFAMIGAPAVPIGLFWMAWTDYSFISIWSPITASVLIGFGMVCVFMSANMYIIDCYEIYAASALTFNALTRYIAAGGFTVVGIPLYENLGTHWTLTLLGAPVASNIYGAPYYTVYFGGLPKMGSGITKKKLAPTYPAYNWKDMLPIIPFLLAATSFSRLVVADEVRCWAPDGKTLADNETVVPCNKLGIQQDGVYSSCCRLDGDATQRDYCTTSGLCLSTLDGVLRREYCTDKTWKSPACVNVCTDPNNDGSSNSTVEMTACSDGTGTYCCGRNELGCCGTDHAIAIPTQASVVSSGGATETLDSSSSPFKSATIGLAVVLGVLIATAAGTVTWLLRKNKSLTKELSEKTEAARHVPPPVLVHPYSNSYGPRTPQIKDSSVPGSPSPAFRMSPNQPPYSELDATMAASRSEMGSPVQHHYDNGEASPRSVNNQPHSPYMGS
ncbi:hypothetical protein E0Z10_g8467 [Xylaria hypoxylon]|uniref:Major facilitator superfamily (MFS) profile domain-containing protein n=1 Tax=Xylaria hypoxylon TaxID=37992 RepID=A0A4Z0YLH0_9PEZI|nr:hypothetical protein E0Z10_g8467 [Xylaria hypoxylon]